MLVPVQVHEVDDAPVQQAVDEITQRATDDQCQSAHEQALGGGGQAPHPHQERAADDEGEGDEEPALPAGGVREEAPGGAGIEGQGDVEHRQDVHALEELKVLHHPRLGQLIRHDHGESERQEAPATRREGQARARGGRGHGGLGGAHTNARSSPGPSTLLTQRAHSCGCRASAPTSGRWCQQRTHFGSPFGRTLSHTPALPVLAAGTAPSGGDATSCTCACEVIRRKRSSGPSAAKRAYSAGAQ